MLSDGQECKKTLAAVFDQIDSLKEAYEKRISGLEAEINSQKGAHDKKTIEHDEARFKMFKANILVELVKKVFVLHLDYPGNLEKINDTNKTRNAQAARSLDQQQLGVFFGEEGNKLGPNVSYAVLLHSDPSREKDDYWKWANLFPYVYGKRVEEIANDPDATDEDEQDREEEWGPIGYAAGDET